MTCQTEKPTNVILIIRLKPNISVKITSTILHQLFLSPLKKNDLSDRKTDKCNIDYQIKTQYFCKNNQHYIAPIILVTLKKRMICQTEKLISHP
jgi:hypothetical protein